MEIEELIKSMKEIYTVLLQFIETTDDPDSEFIELVTILEKQEIKEKEDKIHLLFQILSKIADNHHRTSDFLTKFEQIFQYLINEKSSPISYFIPDYNGYNKRILFLLLEKKFLIPDETFLEKYLHKNVFLKSNQQNFNHIIIYIQQ